MTYPAYSPAAEPRAVCGRCRRPESVCYCRHIRPLDTATRIVLLQHPRERDVAIGTARMASLCLPNSELHVGVRWRGSSVLARALSDPARPPVLLYPGPGAIDVARDPPRGKVTLVVVDGTWWQTRKVVRENPELARLPRYAFTPPSPSEYRIRKEPDAACVSTIEALVHVLGVLEGDAPRFSALLLPFRAMIDAQIACEARFHGSRTRHKRTPRGPVRPLVPAIFRERAADLVCVVGEANAWPYKSRERGDGLPSAAEGHGRVGLPDELVHWTARRLRTGETFEFVVAPKNPIAPRTTAHIELSAETLAAGGERAELLARWRAFVRDTDVVCSWGRYATARFVEAGGHLPEARLDLRKVARVFAKGKVGTLEDFIARLPPGTQAGADERWVSGRAGTRLGQVARLADHFSMLASAP